MKDIKIRQLKLWEVPQLLRFRKENDYNAPFEEKDVDGESALYSFLKQLWHRNRLVTFIAIKDSELLGYVSMVFGKHRKFKGNAYLVNAAVRANERGKGIGAALFKKAEDYAQSRDTRRIELEVFATNTGAVRLYERLGYQIEGIKQKAVENSHGYDDLIFMAKFLKNNE